MTAKLVVFIVLTIYEVNHKSNKNVTLLTQC